MPGFYVFENMKRAIVVASVLDLLRGVPGHGGENGGYGEAKNERPRRAENGRLRES